jgi:ABC-2 type transport system ATP-binding protein
LTGEHNTEVRPALAVEHLTKHYGRTIAVHDISFQIRRNEIGGLLGPNGAGKTTTISMILGVLKPTSGKILIEDIDLARKRTSAWQRVHLSAVYAPLPGNLIVYQNLRVFGLLYSVKALNVSSRQAWKASG